jgi:hypothetical protein
MNSHWASLQGRGQLIRNRFNPDEDHMLRVLVSTYGTNDWQEVARFLPGRNVRQCRDRWNHYLANDAVDVSWTATDDLLLEKKVAELGPDWDRVALSFPNRTAGEVHFHWDRRTQGTDDASATPGQAEQPGTAPEDKGESKPDFSPALPACPDRHDFGDEPWFFHDF